LLQTGLIMETIVSIMTGMANVAPSTPSLRRSRGRPREFDMNEALDKAVRVFSERGYHATSIADLTQAMELASGSVYKAFKDKRAVFLAALDRYKSVRDGKLQQVLATSKSGREKIRDALTFYAESSQGAEGRRGCLVVGGAAELATFDEGVAERVRAAMGRNEALLAGLVRQGQADESIPPHVDCDAAARLLLCIVQGLRIVGKTGRGPDELASVVEIAMKILA
jgi:AcrR family transcriptional regulator